MRKFLFNLGEKDLNATVTLEREGQQRPDVGDNMLVTCTILFPFELRPGSAEKRLDSRIDFGKRVLPPWECYWPWKTGEARYTKQFAGQTWKAAEETALTSAADQLDRVWAAVVARRDALAHAEDSAPSQAIKQTRDARGRFTREVTDE